MKAKVKKQRADKYEKPLKIKGTFDDVIGVAMGKKKEAPDAGKNHDDKAAKPKQGEKNTK